MAKTFIGRVIVPGTAKAEALVSSVGFNTLASYQKSLNSDDMEAICNDPNNPELYKRPMAGKALCLPKTIGSTNGGMLLYWAAKTQKQPACLLFSKPIDSLAATGAALAGVWTDVSMPTVDSLGDEFLAAVQTGMTVAVAEDGTVTVE